MAAPRRRSRTKKTTDYEGPSKLMCFKCGETKDAKKFYGTSSTFYDHIKKIPICNECVDDMYLEYYEQYNGMGYTDPDVKAVKRVCMALDIYYKYSLFESAKRSHENKPDISVMMYYIRNTRLSTNRLKTYDDTLRDEFDASKERDAIMSIYNDSDADVDERISEGKKLFGSGFNREDYMFLYDEYVDWTSRHECDTKSKEELIKQICFVQLDLFKANRAGKDTKTLNDTLTKLMDAAKLQPKQNASDTTAGNQTFGTLIDKWENDRPIPDIDEELRDVDKIFWYISVFFFGHLCKMIGVDNDYSNEYNEYMKAYTVEKPEYDEDDADEAIYRAMFGGDDGDE